MHFELLSFPAPPLETNGYLLMDKQHGKALIIDPGMGSYDYFMPILVKKQCRPIAVLLTHGHYDHIGNVHLFQDAGAKVYLHEKDLFFVEKGSMMGRSFGIDPIDVDYILQGNERLCLAGVEFEVIHTPGHSPGSVCYHDSLNKRLFSGDTLFKGTYGRVDLPGSDPHKMRASLKKLAQLPVEMEVFPGHGEMTKISDELGWMERR